MYYLVVIFGLIYGYLSGSVSYARLFARIGKNVDITKVGNGNPGTSNVSREIGTGWGLLTLLCDALKGSVVMAAFKLLFFSADPVYAVALPFEGAGFPALVLIGIAAILGHAFPVYYKFHGGGSIGVLFGCWLYLILPQFLICTALSYFIVKLFFPKQKYPMGRMTPVVFCVLTPIYLLAETLIASARTPLFPDSLLFDHWAWGQHSVMLIVSIVIFTLTVIPINLRLLTTEVLKKKA
ncbi:MAG: glycerol-3-phosphate acyltransferase [Candidatus Marinimicrobia bacterium]|nr:glycerol-3-phosphate acyltransferase [Candidatus Neomarinimicrobiota bacterium]